MNQKEIMTPQTKELIEQKHWVALRDLIIEWPAPDIKLLLENIDKKERVLLFRLLPRRISSEVFSYLDSGDRDGLLEELTNDETRHLLAELPPDDRTDLLEELPGRVVQGLINLLHPQDRKEALLLLGYPEESVGRLMTPDYVAVHREWTVAHALEHIREKGKDSETINEIYVIDKSWKLLDALELRRFILADPNEPVDQIMDYTFISISSFEDREKAVEMIQHYDLDALPVVNPDGILLGIVTVDDVLDVVEEEITEDFHKTAAVEPLKVQYSEASTLSLYRKRIPWLITLFGVNLLSAGVIAVYEKTLASTIALAFFIPVLMGTGGNVGTQSSTLLIRAIATRDISTKRWLWVMTRELSIGLLIGITMAFLGWTLGFFKGGYEIAIIVSITMVIIVVFTNLIGVTIPFILTRLKIDPAVASSPLIASISDITCLIFYFLIATFLLGSYRYLIH